MHKKREFFGVQILRGVAACMVVMTHVATNLHENFIVNFPAIPSGNAGVEIFFLVSGFVMIVSSYNGDGATLSWKEFLVRRFQRIIPLYWLLTTLKLAVFWIDPGILKTKSFNLVNAVCSYLFIPSYDGQHAIYPVIFVGWTLTFEMIFYYAFALCLAFSLSPFTWLAVAFAALAAMGVLGVGGSIPAASLLSPLLLEFIAGIWLAKVMVLTPRRIPALVALLAASTGFAVIGLTNYLPEPQLIQFRVIFWALPATAVLFGFIALEDLGYFKRCRFALIVGDASYSIYLIHVQIVPLLMARMQGHIHSVPAAIVMFFFTVAVCIGFGILTYFAIERPITRFVRSLFQPARVVQNVPV